MRIRICGLLIVIGAIFTPIVDSTSQETKFPVHSNTFDGLLALSNLNTSNHRNLQIPNKQNHLSINTIRNSGKAFIKRESKNVFGKVIMRRPLNWFGWGKKPPPPPPPPSSDDSFYDEAFTEKPSEQTSNKQAASSSGNRNKPVQPQPQPRASNTQQNSAPQMSKKTNNAPSAKTPKTKQNNQDSDDFYDQPKKNLHISTNPKSNQDDNYYDDLEASKKLPQPAAMAFATAKQANDNDDFYVDEKAPKKPPQPITKASKTSKARHSDEKTATKGPATTSAKPTEKSTTEEDFVEYYEVPSRSSTAKLTSLVSATPSTQPTSTVPSQPTNSPASTLAQHSSITTDPQGPQGRNSEGSSRPPSHQQPLSIGSGNNAQKHSTASDSTATATTIPNNTPTTVTSVPSNSTQSAQNNSASTTTEGSTKNSPETGTTTTRKSSTSETETQAPTKIQSPSSTVFQTTLNPPLSQNKLTTLAATSPQSTNKPEEKKDAIAESTTGNPVITDASEATSSTTSEVPTTVTPTENPSSTQNFRNSDHDNSMSAPGDVSENKKQNSNAFPEVSEKPSNSSELFRPNNSTSVEKTLGTAEKLQLSPHPKDRVQLDVNVNLDNKSFWIFSGLLLLLVMGAAAFSINAYKKQKIATTRLNMLTYSDTSSME